MKKKTWFFSLVFAMILAVVFSGTVFAGGNKSKALKAYDKFLKKEAKKSDCEFDRWGLAYLDNNSVPELIVYKSKSPLIGMASIYTFKKGKVVKISANYGGAYYTHYYKKTSVFKGGFVNSTSDYVCYYSINPKKESTPKFQNLDMLFYREDGKYYKYLYRVA